MERFWADGDVVKFESEIVFKALADSIASRLAEKLNAVLQQHAPFEFIDFLSQGEQR